MGVFGNTGVSVGVQDTLSKGRGELDPITDIVSGWSHTSGAIGGYLSATASIKHSQEYIDEWLENGLGRWITLRNQAGIVRFRGFVDQIDANIAGLKIARGPLSGISNRVKMVYSTVDTSTLPPTMGVRATTTETNDTASQAVYGIWQKVLSCGGATAATAAQLQALYLAEHAQPETVKSVTLGGGNLSMSLHIKGAWDWLTAYVANFTTGGTVNLSARLIAALALDPNAVFSTDVSNITANTFQVDGYDSDDKDAQKVIKALLPPGDAAFNRYTFGFYDQEVPYYAAVPTTLEYLYSLADPAQEVTTLTGNVVRPWDVRPALWLQIPDLMIGRVPDTDLKDDPRNIFIESLTYTAPYGLQVNGAKVGTLAQAMGQLGLSGIGA